MFDFVLRNARIAGRGPAIFDIGVVGEKIAEIAPSIPTEAPQQDVGGRLVTPGFVDTHIHLDKSCILDRCHAEEGTLQEAITQVAAAKRAFTEDDVYERGRRTLEKAILQGTTRMRTHVEVDPRIGLKSFHAIQRLQRDYRSAIDIEICVFPQEGLTNNPRADALLVQALERGARVIGAAPNFDPDHAGQIYRVFDLALEYNVDIDMHLDSGNSPDDMDIALVCELTEKYQLGGRVAIGHGCKYSTMKVDAFHALATRIADAGVAVTSLPATDLFMQGRDQTDNVRRGVVDVNVLVEHGVNCSISTNNILNPFTPLGDCSLIRMANLQANVCQISHPHRLRECFAMLTERSARLMNLKDYGIAVGNPADIVVIDALTPEQAVAENAAPLVVFKRGVRTVTRARAELHHP